MADSISVLVHTGSYQQETLSTTSFRYTEKCKSEKNNRTAIAYSTRSKQGNYRRIYPSSLFYSFRIQIVISEDFVLRFLLFTDIKESIKIKWRLPKIAKISQTDALVFFFSLSLFRWLIFGKAFMLTHSPTCSLFVYRSREREREREKQQWSFFSTQSLNLTWD